MRGIALVIMTTLYFTNPSWNADSLCGSSLTPLTDLGRVELHGQRAGAPQPRLLAWKSVTVAGTPDSITFADSAATWSVWAIWLDLAGNPSCPSNVVGVNATSAVPIWHESRSEMFDVAGRRIQREPDHGVWFVRTGGPGGSVKVRVKR